MFAVSLLVLALGLLLCMQQSAAFAPLPRKAPSKAQQSAAAAADDNKQQLDQQEIQYGGLAHAGVLVQDVDASKAFYMDVFSFIDESHMRPTTLPFRGAFLRFGSGGDQIHLMELPNPDPTSGRPAHGGRDRHVALTINNIDIIKRRLDARGMPCTFSNSGRRALFCRDLDGNAFEFIEDASLSPSSSSS